MPPTRARTLLGRLRADLPLALLAATVFAMPLEVTRPLFPTGSLDLARIGMLVGIAWMLVRAVRSPGSLRLPPTPILLAAAAVIAVDAASLALFRWPGAPKSVAALVSFAAFGLFAYQVVRDRTAVRIVLAALLLSAALEGVLLVAQHVFDFYLWATPQLQFYGRRNGTFVDPNIAARFLVVAVAAGFALLATSEDRRERLAIAAALAIATLGVLMTLSRTGYALLALAVVASPLILRRPRLLAFGPAVVAATFVIGVLVVPSSIARASDLSVSEAQGDPVVVGQGPVIAHDRTFIDPVVARLPLGVVRTYLARGGAAMMEDHPLVGVGLGGFQPELLGPYRGIIPDLGPSATQPIALQHVDILRIGAEEGVVGLAAWLALVLAILWSIRGALAGPALLRPVAWATLVAFVVVLVSAQAEGRFYTDPYLWLVVAVAAWLRRPVAETADAAERRTVRGVDRLAA